MSERKLFDDVARVSALPIPRRGVFKYLAAGVAASALSRLGLAQHNTRCNFSKGSECCFNVHSGQCDPTDGMCASRTPGWRRLADHFCP
jgi:hypothetical protein